MIPAYSDDLWKTAANNLSQADKQNIDFDHAHQLNILADLQALAERSRQECLQKRWKYTRKCVEIIIFRDVFDKFIRWIDIFKQVGDTVVQYDPAHAVLPWAGVRLVLQVCMMAPSKEKAS